MGSFNVGCGISNLSINEGDEAGFVLLAPSVTHRSNVTMPRRHQIYTTDFFEPILPPVFGIYDDYGRLASVKPSVTTDVIEAVFNRPAKDLINAVGPERGLYDSSNELTQLYMAKVTRDNIDVWDAPAARTFNALGFENVDALDGFVEAFAYEDFRVQSKVVTHKGSDHTYSTWTIEGISDGKLLAKDLPAYNGVSSVLDKFAKVTGTLPGYSKEDQAPMRLAMKLSGMFILEDVFSSLKDHLKNDEWLSEVVARNETSIEEVFNKKPTILEGLLGKGVKDFSELFARFPSLAHVSDYDGELLSKLAPYAGSGEYSEVTYLVHIMTSVNRSIQPSFSGEQFGNDDASRVLNAVTENILNLRKDLDEDDEA